MKKSARKFLFLVILAILLAIPAGMALAKELGALTISGPGINGEITLDDPEQMRNFEEAGFLEQSRAVKAPDGLGEGYLLTFFLNMEDGLQPWLQVTYYPGPAGESGYLNAVDLLMEGASTDGRWYLAAPQAESALRDLLAAHGASFAVLPAAGEAEVVESPANQLEQEPAVSANAEAAQEQAAQPAVPPAVAEQPAASSPSIPAFSPGMFWAASLLAGLLLALFSIRWLVARQSSRAVK